MHAFVISFTNGSNVDCKDVSQKMTRLVAANWRAESEQTGFPTAVVGRATLANADNWVVCGLALLTNASTLRECLKSSETDDISLIAEARAKLGRSFHEHLSGGFSVVLVNQKSGEVEGYRDHFGVIPFHYCIYDGVLTCGSDIRSVLHLSAIPVAEDKTRISDFLFAEDVDPRITAFSGLGRLQAAHVLTFDKDGMSIQRYWMCEQPLMIDADTAASELYQRLNSATAECLNKSTETGAMLSGGLDSSSLTVLAVKALAQKDRTLFPTLSFVYDNSSSMDESDYIDAINSEFRTEPHKIDILNAPKLAELSDLIEEQMDLFLGFGIPKSRTIYREAARKNVLVLIDGHGGDEVISHGHDRLIELATARQWWLLFREMQGSARIYGTPIWGPFLWYAAHYGGLSEKHIVRRVLIRLARQALPRKAERESLLTADDVISEDILESIDRETRYAKDVGPKTKVERLSAERIAHLKVLRDPRIETAFEALHRSAVQQGVLPMYPFFDRDVVELCLSVPSSGKLRNGQTRWVLREAMRGILPETVRTRSTKTSFNDEFQASVLQYLKTTGDDAFSGLDRYVRQDQVIKLKSSVLESESPDVEELRLCWRLAVLRQWTVAFESWRTLQRRGELI